MPIITLQRRSRELGRIRIGQQVTTNDKNRPDKTRPVKLECFRFTSASRELIAKVATLYGGEVADWTGAGTAQYEVITTANRLPVLVPPQPVSQFYELWSGGGCQRRCDGERELLSEQPCLCSPDPEERACKPTTRLNVVLQDVEGVGVWRLESHGYYAATELPSTAEFLAQTGGYIRGWLALEERIIKRTGQPTRRFMVPTIEVDVTPAALMAGGGTAAALTTGGQAPALGAAPAAEPLSAVTVSDVEAAATMEELRKLYDYARSINQPADDAVKAAFAARAAALEQSDQQPTQPPPTAAAAAPAVDESAARLSTQAQRARIHGAIGKCEVTGDDQVRSTLARLLQRELKSRKEITFAEAQRLIDTLDRCAADPQPAFALDAVLGALEMTVPEEGAS